MIPGHLLFMNYESTVLGKPPVLSAQKAHLAALAKARSDGAQRPCLDCRLPLAPTSAALRCATCAAKRKLEQDRHRHHLRPKINRRFVGAMPKLEPKPADLR